MFWDSSAFVPLFITEPRSAEMTAFLRQERAIIWWATVVECQSALQRSNREYPFPPGALDLAVERLDKLITGCVTIEATEEVRRRVRRLLAVHPIRAADALQLAAALVFAGEEQGLSFVCLDDRLRLAASKEGFRVLPLNDHPPQTQDR